MIVEIVERQTKVLVNLFLSSLNEGGKNEDLTLSQKGLFMNFKTCLLVTSD